MNNKEKRGRRVAKPIYCKPKLKDAHSRKEISAFAFFCTQRFNSRRCTRCSNNRYRSGNLDVLKILQIKDKTVLIYLDVWFIVSFLNQGYFILKYEHYFLRLVLVFHEFAIRKFLDHDKNFL